MNPVTPRFGALYLVNNASGAPFERDINKELAAEELAKLLNGDGYYKMPESVEVREPKPTDPGSVKEYRRVGTIGRQIRSLFREQDHGFEPDGTSHTKPAASSYKNLVATGSDAPYLEWLQDSMKSANDLSLRGWDFMKKHIVPELDDLMKEAEQSGRKLDVTLQKSGAQHIVPTPYNVTNVNLTS